MSIASAQCRWAWTELEGVPDETEDMANIGRALMARLPKGYHWSDCPTEIVTDLQNEIHDLKQTSAFPGLKSLSYRPDLPLVDLVMTFESMETAQVARARITDLVMPPEEPPRELSPSEADEVQIGRSQAELAVLKKDGRSYEIRRIAGQALEVITRLWAARSTTKATGQSVAREDVFECPATRVTCRRHCQYGDCAIRGSENGPERRLAPLWSGDPPGSEVPAFSRQAAGLGPFPRPPDPGSDAALFAVQRENERLREALRGVMECSGTSCRHYHIAHDALQADAGAARDG